MVLSSSYDCDLIGEQTKTGDKNTRQKQSEPRTLHSTCSDILPYTYRDTGQEKKRGDGNEYARRPKKHDHAKNDRHETNEVSGWRDVTAARFSPPNSIYGMEAHEVSPH